LKKRVVTHFVTGLSAAGEYVGFQNQNAWFSPEIYNAALSFHGSCDARCYTRVIEL
jgi:hypothetical protein